MKHFAVICMALMLVSMAASGNSDNHWKTQKGQKVNLSDGRHELIFLDALCPMPHFPGCEKILKRLAERPTGNRLLVFNTLYADAHSIRRFVKKHRLPMPVIIDADMTLHDRYGVYATPYRVVIENSSVVSKGDMLAQAESAVQ